MKLREGIIIIKRVLIIVISLVYIVGVLLLIYGLNKQNAYSPPPYMQNIVYNKENEVKLNNIGYKVKDIEEKQEIKTDNNKYKANGKYVIFTIRVANYKDTDFIIKRNQFAISNKDNLLNPDMNITNVLNKKSNNFLKLNSIGSIKKNNIKNFKLVFDVDLSTLKSKELYLNINPKIISKNKISFTL